MSQPITAELVDQINTRGLPACVAAQLCPGTDPVVVLFGALRELKEGNHGGATALLKATPDKDHPDLLWVRAKVNIICENVLEATRLLDRAISSEIESGFQWEILCDAIKLNHRLGRYRAVDDIVRSMQDTDSAPPFLHRSVANYALTIGDHALAAKHLERSSRGELKPDLLFRDQRNYIHSLIELGQSKTAQMAARTLLSKAPAGRWNELATLLETTGDYRVANKIYQRMVQHPTERTLGLLGVARLALWGQDFTLALSAASSVDTSRPMLQALAQRIVGGAHVLRGDFGKAQAAIKGALAINQDDYETHIWKAELELRSADFESSARSLRTGSELAENAPDPFSFLCLRILWGLRSEAYEDESLELSLNDVRAGVAELFPQEPLRSTDSRDKTARLLERCLERMGGNRSLTPTALLPDGPTCRLTRLTPFKTLRTQCKYAAWEIRGRSLTQVHQLFDDIESAHPDSPLVHTYRGEINLWCGDLSRAEADFQQGIVKPEETALWAYIGLGATKMLQGSYEEALKLYQQSIDVSGLEGISLYAYRGEAHLLRGNLDDGLKDLERAVQQRPQRVGSWIALALTHHAKGKTNSVRNIFTRLRGQAVALMCEAIECCGLDPATSSDDFGREDIVNSLRQARTLLRGNRASALVTYFDRSQRICFVPTKRALDAQYLLNTAAQARATLEYLAGLRPLSYALPAGCEPTILSMVAPHAPGDGLGGGTFEVIQIVRAHVVIRVIEPNGVRREITVTHPSHASHGARQIGNSRVHVEDSPGPVTRKILQAMEAQPVVDLPWVRVDKLPD